MLVAAIEDEANRVLIANRALVARLAAERKRFEDWLRLEVFKVLMLQRTCLEIEKSYPNSKERCDFWSCEPGEPENWVEVKLCVTNYCNDFTGAVSSRPITNQISDIQRDIEKLGRLPRETCRAILFAAYPMPRDYRSHSAWGAHISSIKSCAPSIEERFEVPLQRNGKSASVVGYRITL